MLGPQHISQGPKVKKNYLAVSIPHQVNRLVREEWGPSQALTEGNDWCCSFLRSLPPEATPLGSYIWHKSWAKHSFPIEPQIPDQTINLIRKLSLLLLILALLRVLSEEKHMGRRSELQLPFCVPMAISLGFHSWNWITWCSDWYFPYFIEWQVALPCWSWQTWLAPQVFPYLLPH